MASVSIVNESCTCGQMGCTIAFDVKVVVSPNETVTSCDGTVDGNSGTDAGSTTTGDTTLYHFTYDGASSGTTYALSGSVDIMISSNKKPGTVNVTC